MSGCVICSAMLARRNLASSFLPITSLQPQWFHAITHSFAQRRHAIPPILNSFRTLLPLTAISFFATHFHAFARFLSSIQPQLSSFQSLGASLRLFTLFFRTPSVCFQQLAASFSKTPGWGGVDYQLAAGSDPFKTFRRSDLQTFGHSVHTFRHSDLQTFSARMLVIP